MKPKRVPENSLPLNQRILVQRRTQMEMFPTCSLLASSPVIIMLLLWYSESVSFFFVCFSSAAFCLFVFLISTRFSFSHFRFLESSCLHRSVGHFHASIFLHFQSCVLFTMKAKKASVLKLTLFKHECCGRNTPGRCRQLKSNWKYMLCFR